MSVRLHHCLGLTLALLAISQLRLRSEEATPSRPTPIVFSAPKSDTVSSNLNQIGTRTSPLTDLESGLKKPFEIFDTSRSSSARPINQFVPPSPALNNRRMKDALEKRAEDNYLLREDNESATSKDDLLKSDDDPFDPMGKSPKTPLDRYYDSIDRLRLAQTNRPARSLDLFAENNDPDEKDDSKSRTSGGLFDKELSANTRTSGQMTNNAAEGGRSSSEKLKPRSFGDIFEVDQVKPVRSTTRTKETRLDEFKRLLDGPGYGARNEFNVTPPTPSISTTYQPPKPFAVAPSSILSATPQPVGGSLANSPGFAGAVGVPSGVPDYAVNSPSLTPTPPLQQTTPKPPVPSFNVPRRRF